MKMEGGPTDNPKKLWFKAKKYGWGWYPASREGWLIMLVYIAALVKILSRADFNASYSAYDTLFNFVLPSSVLTATLIVIAYKKGGKPRWHWGGKEY